jgi:hypothetical protein
MDIKADIEKRTIDALRNNAEIIKKIESGEGVAWGTVKAFFKDNLPDVLDDKDEFAYNLVRKSMNEIFGNNCWDTYKNEKNATCIRKKMT